MFARPMTIGWRAGRRWRARLGFATDIRHDKLDDGAGARPERKSAEALAKECPSCSYLRPPKVSI